MTIYQSTNYRLRQLFSTLAAVTTSNLVLLEGERWNEKHATTGRFTGRSKTGDGVVSSDGTTIIGTAFNDLPFDPGNGGTGTAAPALARRIDASGITTIYVGRAAAGTAESATGWTVIRTTYSALGALQTTATGSGAWINRASLTYSS
jgi:hypothetical protein